MLGHKSNDLKSISDFNSAWADRLAYLILAGLLVDIADLFIPEGWWKIVAAIGANLLIFGGVWGELWFAKRAREADDSRVAQANKQAAEAQRETEQIRAENLAMQAGLRPRRIPTGASKPTAEQFPEVAKYAGTTALIQSVPRDFEAQTLAEDIFLVLSDLGWKPTILSAESDWLVDPRMIGEGIRVTTVEKGGPVGGTSYSPANSDAGRAAEALVAMLETCLSQSQFPSPPFSAYWIPEYAEMPFLFHGKPNPPKDAVIVLIGMRSLTFSLPPFSTPKFPV
jgi:hypothetical protein